MPYADNAVRQFADVKYKSSSAAYHYVRETMRQFCRFDANIAMKMELDAENAVFHNVRSQVFASIFQPVSQGLKNDI